MSLLEAGRLTKRRVDGSAESSKRSEKTGRSTMSAEQKKPPDAMMETASAAKRIFPNQGVFDSVSSGSSRMNAKSDKIGRRRPKQKAVPISDTSDVSTVYRGTALDERSTRSIGIPSWAQNVDWGPALSSRRGWELLEKQNRVAAWGRNGCAVEDKKPEVRKMALHGEARAGYTAAKSVVLASGSFRFGVSR